MSDFSQPAYASYVALCRELKLERKFEGGDQCCDTGNGFDIELISHAFAGEFLCGSDERRDYWQTGPDRVWLPSLSDWLEMLEAAGLDELLIQNQGGYAGWVISELLPPEWDGMAGDPEKVSYGPTREEAAARLWMAVTGRAENQNPARLTP